MPQSKDPSATQRDRIQNQIRRSAETREGGGVKSLPKKITIGDKYRPAMEMTEQADADAYFELCVAHTMSYGSPRDAAEDIERANLGYFAGYYNDETRARVERLFRCKHPVFGSIVTNGAPTPEQALKAGINAGRGAS